MANGVSEIPELYQGHVTVSEMEVIGSLMLAPKEMLPIVRGIIRESDFNSDLAKAAYIAICQLYDEGAVVDYGPMQARAEKNGTHISNDYLVEMWNLAATTGNLKANAEALHAAALDRDARAVGMSLMSGAITTGEAYTRLEQILQGTTAGTPEPMSDAEEFLAMFEKAQSGEGTSFLETGFTELDEILQGGFTTDGLNIIAARPGTGKTVMGLAIAENVAARGDTVLYISLEMKRTDLWVRRVAAATGVFAGKIQRGQVEDQRDQEKVENAAAALSLRKFIIYDKPCDMDDIESLMRSTKDLKLCVIDHIGLIKQDYDGDKRYEAMTKISHQLKRLGLALNIPILGLCQLNRQNEQRSGKRPTMADLRDSGAIEEDSDVVMLLFRPALYLPKEEQPKPYDAQDFEVIVDKDRHGGVGQVTMDFTPSTLKLSERGRW